MQPEGAGYKDLFNEISVSALRIEFYENDATPASMCEHLRFLSETGARKFSNGITNHLPSVVCEDSPAKVVSQNPPPS